MPVKASANSTHICFPITLRFTGQHIPSFKNSKLLTRGKLITKPEYQKVMKDIIRAFESGLRSAILTGDSATLTEDALRRWTVSVAQLKHFDDNRFWVSEITVDCMDVPKGEEGCDLTLEIL